MTGVTYCYRLHDQGGGPRPHLSGAACQRHHDIPDQADNRYTPSQSVIDAMELMMVNNFRHLPVVGGCRSCSRVCRVGLLACKCLAGLALLSVWIRKHTWRWHRAKLCMDSVNCQTVPYRQSEGGFAFSGARWHLPGHAQHA